MRMRMLNVNAWHPAQASRHDGRPASPSDERSVPHAMPARTLTVTLAPFHARLRAVCGLGELYLLLAHPHNDFAPGKDKPTAYRLRTLARTVPPARVLCSILPQPGRSLPLHTHFNANAAAGSETIDRAPPDPEPSRVGPRLRAPTHMHPLSPVRPRMLKWEVG